MAAPHLGHAGNRSYSRARDLPKLIAVWPREISDYSLAGTEHVIARIRRVIRKLYGVALFFPSSYEAGRHVALYAALRAELERLAFLKSQSKRAA